MRIGINITPSTDGIEGLTEAARGFDSAWTNQQPGGWDPLALLASVEGGPPELGTAVVPTFPRHPVALATEALTAQVLTGGRLTLGVGPSHAWYMTDQLGLPYSAPAKHTREYLEVLRPLLRGEHVRHSGRFFTVDTRLAIKADPPPVLISALGPRMLEVARDLADGTIAVWVRPELVAEHLVPSLGDGARIVVAPLVAITDDPDGVRAAVAKNFATVGEMPAYRAVLDRAGLAGPADTVVAGTEAEVVRELRRFRDAGVTDLVVSGLGSPVERARVRDAVIGGLR
ncbi:TIGR03564 family F420-dependent LLM class oxidoreductase [Amycolatopsis sp. CA-230715]|uniref:TIGR03564 family F420-dependent LLM class oxidoreductase n=1 Tax=Amycolatopsis sp. CA-230715 TaxID=2745196 RepID=UPI001C0223EF|nr:TIGR03564 family F420-dependent LLM class oxidoreductase [Amycolatopsis sp. CA-230715]QWF82065.1 F420-dependent glucose-6-phosphate dehydrogenase [Amycolatopsis sp. CA-230715]